MQIHISTNDGVPIYLQIVNQVKYLVASGRLRPGEELTPIRVLAEQLLINPNTVARAYRELERDEVIETSPGRGSFVRSDGAAVQTRRAANDVVDSVLSDAVRQTRALGLDRAETIAAFERALDRWFSTGEKS